MTRAVHYRVERRISTPGAFIYDVRTACGYDLERLAWRRVLRGGPRTPAVNDWARVTCRRCRRSKP
jgi:hypothetical protein